MPSGIEAIIACPNCKRNILTDGTPTENLSLLEGQVLALTLVNKSQDETINIWKQEVGTNKILIEELNNKIDGLYERLERYEGRTADRYGMDWDHETQHGSLRDLEEYTAKLEEKNKALKEQIRLNSWESPI